MEGRACAGKLSVLEKETNKMVITGGMERRGTERRGWGARQKRYPSVLKIHLQSQGVNKREI